MEGESTAKKGAEDVEVKGEGGGGSVSEPLAAAVSDGPRMRPNVVHCGVGVMGPRTARYLPDIVSRLEKLKESRGEQLRPVRIVLIGSGMAVDPYLFRATEPCHTNFCWYWGIGAGA